MLDYVYGHDQLIAQFVAQLIPSCRARGFNASALTAMGIIDGDGRLVAGMVYHNWDPRGWRARNVRRGAAGGCNGFHVKPSGGCTATRFCNAIAK